MLIEGNRRIVPDRCPRSASPNSQREQLMNWLCELREDPHFAEWCRLTSALGLGALTLGQIAALPAGTAESVFPELGEWGRTGADDFANHALRALVPFGPDDLDGATDSILVDGSAGLPTTWRADGIPSPGVDIPESFATVVDGAFGGGTASSSADDRRAG